MTLLVDDFAAADDLAEAEALLEEESSLLATLKRSTPPWPPGEIRVKVPFFTSSSRTLRIWVRT